MNIPDSKVLNRSLRVTLTEWPPFIMPCVHLFSTCFKNESTELAKCKESPGFVVEILIFIADRLHLSLEWLWQPSNEFGRKLQNGSWDGIMAKLMNNATDLSFLGVSDERSRYVQFAQFSFFHDSNEFAVHPIAKRLPLPVWDTFEPIVWIIFLLIQLFISIFILRISATRLNLSNYLDMIFQVSFRRKQHNLWTFHWFSTVLVTFWAVAALIFSKFFVPTFSTLLLTNRVIGFSDYSSLTAVLNNNVYSILLPSPSIKIIDTLTQSVYMEDQKLKEAIFAKPFKEYGTISRTLKEINDRPGTMTIYSKLTIAYFKTQMRYNFTCIKNMDSYPSILSFAFRKQSKVTSFGFVEEFSLSLHELNDAGIIGKAMKKYIKADAESDNIWEKPKGRSFIENEGLTISTLFDVFSIWAAFLGLAIILLITETVTYRLRNC